MRGGYNFHMLNRDKYLKFSAFLYIPKGWTHYQIIIKLMHYQIIINIKSIIRLKPYHYMKRFTVHYLFQLVFSLSYWK